MNKKNLSMLCSLFVFAVCSQAQMQKSSFGIHAGATFASVKAKASGIYISSSIHTGFTAGIVSSFNLGKSFSFRPELNFTQKGGIINISGIENIKDKLTLNYIELPLNFVYNTNSSKGKFFAGAGPSFAFGVSGKERTSGMVTDEHKVKFGSGDNADFKAFDFGLNLLTGYQFENGLFFSGNYNFGISNISPDNSEKDYNRYFGITIGFMFPGKGK